MSPSEMIDRERRAWERFHRTAKILSLLCWVAAGACIAVLMQWGVGR